MRRTPSSAGLFPRPGPRRRSGRRNVQALESPRWWNLAAASLALGLVVATQADASRLSPSIERRYAGPSASARHSVVQVRQKLELVERGLLEYAPTEIAPPSVDPLTGELFVGTRDGWVRLFDRATRVVWRRDLGARPTGSALLTDAAVFVGTADGKLWALDRFSGEVRWSVQLRAQVMSRPREDFGILVVGTNQDAVQALDAETGEILWSYRRGAGLPLTIRGGTSVTLDDGTVYAGFSDGSLVALGGEDGRMLWQAATAPSSVLRFPDADAAPVVRDGVVYSSVFNDGVYAFEATTGKIRWRHDAQGAHALTLEGDTLLVGGARRALALDAETGARRWALDLEGTYVTQPLVARRIVFLAGPQGIRMADLKTGRPLEFFQPGSGFSAAPVARGDEVWALSNLGNLYELQIVTGRRGDSP